MRLSICATALLVTLGLAGCQSTPKLVQQQQAQAQATEHYLNAQSHLEQLERRFAQASKQNLARFAPEQMERADDALADAREEFDDIRYTPSEADESDVEDILLAVNQANIELDSATLIRDTARKVLQPTLEMMSVLEQLAAADHFPREMKRAGVTLEEMLEEVADGDLDDARENQAQLLLLLRAIEVKTVEEIRLSPLEQQLEQMRRNRLARTVPISFQAAVASLEMAKSVIAADPRDGGAIDAAVAKAAFEMDHSRHIAQEVKNLRVMDDEDYEAYLLSVENRLRLLADALDGEDRRNLPMDQQAQSLQRAIAELKQLGQSLANDNRALAQAVEQASQQQPLLAEADTAPAAEGETTQEVSVDRAATRIESAPGEHADTAGMTSTEAESPEVADAVSDATTDSGVTP